MTIPSELYMILYQNQTKVYNILFKSVAETLEVAQILNANGVDLSKIKLREKGIKLTLGEILQKGIDIKKIIEEDKMSFFTDFSFREFISAFVVLQAIIDVPGNIPIVLNIQNKGIHISARRAALYSFFEFVFILKKYFSP